MKKKKNSNKKKSKIGYIFFVFLFGYFIYVVIDQQKIINEKTAQLKGIESNIQQEVKKSEELKKTKDSINSDEYVIKTAREKLGMIDNDERIFMDINK